MEAMRSKMAVPESETCHCKNNVVSVINRLGEPIEKEELQNENKRVGDRREWHSALDRGNLGELDGERKIKKGEENL